MRHTFEIYPEYKDSDDKPLYFIELSRWEEKDPLTWQLFKRNFIYSKEEWQESVKRMGIWSNLMSREGHPWNLGEGVVLERDGAVDMNTLPFLKFMVDSLNKNSNE